MADYRIIHSPRIGTGMRGAITWHWIIFIFENYSRYCSCQKMPEEQLFERIFAKKFLGKQEMIVLEAIFMPRFGRMLRLMLSGRWTFIKQ